MNELDKDFFAVVCLAWLGVGLMYCIATSSAIGGIVVLCLMGVPAERIFGRKND